MPARIASRRGGGDGPGLEGDADVEALGPYRSAPPEGSGGRSCAAEGKGDGCDGRGGGLGGGGSSSLGDGRVEVLPLVGVLVPEILFQTATEDTRLVAQSPPVVGPADASLHQAKLDGCCRELGADAETLGPYHSAPPEGSGGRSCAAEGKGDGCDGRGGGLGGGGSSSLGHGRVEVLPLVPR